MGSSGERQESRDFPGEEENVTESGRFPVNIHFDKEIGKRIPAKRKMRMINTSETVDETR